MKKYLAVAVVLACSAIPGKAQFGGIVADPGQYLRDGWQLQQLISSYNQAVSQYQLMQNMVQTLKNMPSRYQSVLSQWRGFSNTNIYNNTSAWTGAANSGSNVPGAYSQVTNPLQTYLGSIFASMSPDAQGRVMNRVATIELQDGANQTAMEELGQIRQNGQQASQQLSNLQNDTFGGSLDTQLQVSQQNAAAAITQAQLQTDTNRLLVSVAEQQVLASKAARDEAAVALATDAQAKATGPTFAQESFSGAGAAMDAYKPVN